MRLLPGILIGSVVLIVLSVVAVRVMMRAQKRRDLGSRARRRGAAPPAMPSTPEPRLDAGNVVADTIAPRGAPSLAIDTARVPARRLVAPVELWFGTTCVGVVRGSDTHERFSRYANGLLAELAAGSDSREGGSPRV